MERQVIEHPFERPAKEEAGDDVHGGGAVGTRRMQARMGSNDDDGGVAVGRSDWKLCSRRHVQPLNRDGRSVSSELFGARRGSAAVDDHRRQLSSAALKMNRSSIVQCWQVNDPDSSRVPTERAQTALGCRRSGRDAYTEGGAMGGLSSEREWRPALRMFPEEKNRRGQEQEHRRAIRRTEKQGMFPSFIPPGRVGL